jgi:hypothetical protein
MRATIQGKNNAVITKVPHCRVATAAAVAGSVLTSRTARVNAALPDIPSDAHTTGQS